jgi:tRNA nucleotidyltransferase/poly(A) polymerase
MSTSINMRNAFFSKMKNAEIAIIFTNLYNFIEDNGSNLWLVGGQIRDYVYQHQPKDTDLATNCDVRLIYKYLKNVDSNALKMKYYSKYKTLTIQIANNQLNIAQLRSEIYDYKTNDILLSFHNSIRKDLLRRDFTMNSIAIDLNIKNVASFIDPHRGFEDLQNKILRSHHNNSYADDPTRILRAARYVAKYNLILAKNEYANIQNGLKRMYLISMEKFNREIYYINEEESRDISMDILSKWGVKIK